MTTYENIPEKGSAEIVPTAENVPVAEATRRKFCSNCGKSLSLYAPLCPNCGHPTDNYHPYPPQQQQNQIVNVTLEQPKPVDTRPTYRKWTAFWLCFFFGVLGAHRFYVGKGGTGILMLLLVGTGLSLIWAIFDLIWILCGWFEDEYGRELK